MIKKHGCNYLNNAFKPAKLVAVAREHLADVDYDTIVGTGLSGTIAGATLAAAFNKHLLIVRKPTDKSHSYFEPWQIPVEGYIGNRWIFIDDLVSSGTTRNRVLEAVESLPKDDGESKYVGTYLYGDEFGFAGFSPVSTD